MITDALRCQATGKRRYPTPGDAKASIQTKMCANRSKGRRKKAVGKSTLKRHYYCPHCKGFHLTSSEYGSKQNYIKKVTEYKKKIKGLVLSPEEALQWKKNSLPFPKI